ncbi:PP2C family protein-serine/threonine phosphatase [Flavisolibacter tropicus]|uniref:PP2C family protein-serine/threonine phosphatase n=1 Tax=Flavisolibacter tropicus TaxID=1492898 RepID=UPI00082DB391|nr:protein phosphatase 2C domain-containing protein [Flavisolibacter tropicus]
MAKHYFGITDVGRQRDNNEDTFFIEPVLNKQFIAACVIDGVGGYEGGEVAAAIAQQSILAYLQIPSGEVLSMMREAMSSANENIYAEKTQTGKNPSMACVATMALVDTTHNKFYYAHVGDTRLYLFRDKTLVKVSKDHSFVGFLEDSGRITEEAAMQHLKRNEISKALGFESPLPNPSEYIETGESPFLPGDTLLLCSDGLTDMIDSAVISSVLNNGDTLEGKCRSLVDAANRAGGKDNVTVVLVQHPKKPLKQAAKKPATPVKKNESQPAEPRIQQQPVVTPVATARVAKPYNLPIILSIACFVLLTALVWALFFRGPKASTTPELAPTVAPTLQEQRLNTALNRMTGDTLWLRDSLAMAPIYLTDTLHLRKDTLVLKSPGSILLARDSSFKTTGASIVIGPQAKYVLFENLILQDMVIATTNPYVLHFKNTRFRNSYVQIRQGIRYNDSLFTGSVLDMQKAMKDSLPQNRNN